MFATASTPPRPFHEIASEYPVPLRTLSLFSTDVSIGGACRVLRGIAQQRLPVHKQNLQSPHGEDQRLAALSAPQAPKYSAAGVLAGTPQQAAEPRPANAGVGDRQQQATAGNADG
jgi:hypothetical protein